MAGAQVLKTHITSIWREDLFSSDLSLALKSISKLESFKQAPEVHILSGMNVTHNPQDFSMTSIKVQWEQMGDALWKHTDDLS